MAYSTDEPPCQKVPSLSPPCHAKVMLLMEEFYDPMLALADAASPSTKVGGNYMAGFEFVSASSTSHHTPTTVMIPRHRTYTVKLDVLDVFSMIYDGNIYTTRKITIYDISKDFHDRPFFC